MASGSGYETIGSRVASHQGVAYVPKLQWSNRPLDYSDLKPAGSLYRRVTLHHTRLARTPRAVEALHRGDQNWWRKVARGLGINVATYESGDVGYNFLVGPDGTIYEGRSLKYLPDHVSGHNPGNIGVAALGDYSNRAMPARQADVMRQLAWQLTQDYPINDVRTHADWNARKHAELGGAEAQIAPMRS